ncbi:RDD family protein [Actinocrispum wychmicini]|uniref:RDD family protein n=1 Tax=Actinocrispum wychmicini TaxID=1213861 RepID=A0A4R2J1V5_9PSEU|nr:RDD family protein [Actinocrispum wychmicini]TCO50856.1 RDD family protein [Actinocrispum wychmicini]
MPAAHRADRDVAVVGGQRVVLATFGGRLLARLVDVVIVGAPWALVFWALPPIGLLTEVVLVVATLVIYEFMCSSHTPGKRVAHVQVVRVDTGEPPGLVRVLVRSLVLYLLTWPVNAVVAFFDERLHRGVHDFVTRTVVVQAD